MTSRTKFRFDKNMTDQDFFFQYDKDPSVKTKFSNLNLLRRDIYTCLGTNPDNLSLKLGSSALWPGTMGILAGIDLLAKFFAGEDAYYESKDRFIKFANEYIDKSVSEELYQLRNALLHSFGLYSKGKGGKEYMFVLTQDPSFFIKYSPIADKYFISIKTLHDKFEKSIAVFYSEYPTSDSYNKFDELFKKYGTTEIGKSIC